tara:strand:+ start:278 stop:472 length:195 start_codon:yes stop_codon:yes gene_type:complete
MKIKKIIQSLLYGTPIRRKIMRFVEIALLGGLNAVVFSSEIETIAGTAFGALMLKTIRDTFLKR